MKTCFAIICIGCGLGKSDTKQTNPIVVTEKKQVEKSEKEPLIFSRWAAWQHSAQLRKK